MGAVNVIQDDFSVEIQHILSSIFCFQDREPICMSITEKNKKLFARS